MRKTKRRIETLSFWDHAGISRHLEKMASKGWMIEKIVNTGWVYRRIEPKHVHFAVSYYPKASEFDPEPSEEQKMFHDFCAHTGWQLVCTSAQMQIFYNENENPIPIETEPELEVQAIHASAKKSFFLPYGLFLIIAVMNIAMFVSGLLGDPIEMLSNPSRLFSGFAFMMLAMLSIVEMGGYFWWLYHAKKAAKQGEFLRGISTSKFQKCVLVLVVLGAVYWAVNYIVFGDSLKRWVAIAMGIYIPALFVIVNATKEALKRKKASRGVNRTVTILTSFVISFTMMGLIVGGTLFASSHGLFVDKNEETYEHRGMTWVIHKDELPLTVEDLVEIEYDGYIKECRGESSFLLGQFFLHQRPRYDAENYASIPQLEYTITQIRVPALYEFCKNRLMYEKEVVYPNEKQEYKRIDAAPWGAKDAYRLYDSIYGAENVYLLCYDKMIVEIMFDWEIANHQMNIAGKKLQGL